MQPISNDERKVNARRAYDEGPMTGPPTLSHILCADYAKANMKLEEAVALADEKGALFWKATAMVLQGCVLALTGKASDAVQMISDATAAFRSTGATLWMPLYLSYLFGQSPRGPRQI